ncbi:MAG TPA: hypothetical protein VGG97_28755 [Bryobacteraceae bacterium]
MREDGYLMALQADTGKLLWRVNTGSHVMTSPSRTMAELFKLTRQKRLVRFNYSNSKAC